MNSSFTKGILNKMNVFKPSGSSNMKKGPMPFSYVGWNVESQNGPFKCDHCSHLFFSPTEHWCTRVHFAMNDEIPLFHPEVGPKASDTGFNSRFSPTRSPSTPSKIDKGPIYRPIGKSFYSDESNDGNDSQNLEFNPKITSTPTKKDKN